MQEDQDNERESGDVAVYAEVDQAWLMGAIESMLFVTDEPVGVLTFADMLQVDPARVQESLVCLQRELEQAERGIQLREVAGGWSLYTHPRYHELIERYVLSWDTRKLSQAALETLAVVAYCQPITRNGVASVRGVSSDSSINSLVEKGLLREAGTQDAPGNPVLYATTRTFLEKFGLRSVRDLPPLDSFAPDEETRAFISERLNVVRPEDEAVRVGDVITKEKTRRRIIFGGSRKLGWLPSLHQARDINAQFATHGLFNRLESQCMIFMACHSRNGQGAHHARALNAQGEATACWRIILIRHASPFEGMEPLFTPTLPKI